MPSIVKSINDKLFIDSSGHAAVVNSDEFRTYQAGLTSRYGSFYTDSNGTWLSSWNGAGEPLYLNAPHSTASIRFYTAGSERMRLSNNGNLLIGTTTDAGYKLDVNGSARISSASGLTIDGFNSNTGLRLNYGNASGQISVINIIANGITNGYIGIQMVDSSNGDLWFGGSGNRAMTVYRNGNVGIGTNDPSTILHLEKSSASNDITGTPSIIISNRNSTSGTFISGGIFNNPYRDVSSSGVTAGVWFENQNSPDAGALAKASALVFGANSYSQNWNTPTERMRITQDGNVGIGTANPRARLNIWTPSTTGLQTALRLNNPFGFDNLNTGAKIVFSQDRSTAEDYPMGELGVGQGAAGTSDFGYMFFSTRNSGSMGERMRIVSNGNVLIGTTTDNGYKLSVNGSGYFNGIGYFENRVATNNSFSDANNVRILKPLGGSRNSFAPGETGAIKITYPVGWTNTMHRVKFNIYNYQENQAYTVYFGGYNYGPGTYWANTFAYTITPSGTDFNPTVRFGYDGTYMVVYIGELNWSWSYPQFFIEEVECGFNLSSSLATDAWSIGLEASAFQNVTATRSNTQSTNWARNGSTAYYNIGNVGIGNDSPQSNGSSAVLDVGNTQGGTLNLRDTNTGIAAEGFNQIYGGDNRMYLYAGGSGASSYMQFYTNDVERMRIASNGVLGIGIVPNANWGTGNNYSATQFRNAALYYRTTGAEFYIMNNSYYDGSSWRYMSGAGAAMLELGDNNFEFFSVASGNAGDSFTWSSRMKIVGGTGNVLIGTTADAGYKLRVVGSTYTTGDVVVAKTTTANADFGGPVLSLGDSTSEVGMAGGIAFAENLTSAVANVSMGIYYDGKANKMHFTGSSDAQATAGQNLIAATKHLTITRDAGNIGIGTTGPDAKLDVYGNAIFRVTDGSDTTGGFTITNDGATPAVAPWPFNSNPVFLVTSSNVANPHIGINQSSDDAEPAKIIGYKSRGTTGANGNVADGDEILQIGGYALHTAGPNYYKPAGDITFKKNDGGGTASTYAPSDFRFRTANSVSSIINAMWIKYNGNVLIGTDTDAGYKLDVATGADGNVLRLLAAAGNQTYFGLDSSGGYIETNGASTGRQRLRLQSYNGSAYTQLFIDGGNQYIYTSSNVNVGIGTAGPSYKLDVAGDARITSGSLGVGVAPNATDGRIDASNDIVAYQTSDQRLKENVTPIENALEKVKSLTGVEFDWIEEHKHIHGYEGHDTGIIAQQVQAVMPTAVRTNDTGYLSVRYEKLIGLLIEANKELAARVEELEKKLK